MNAVTYFVSALCLGLVRLEQSPRQPYLQDQRRPVVQCCKISVKGLVFVVINNVVSCCWLKLPGRYAFGASALTTLFPVFAKSKLLGVGPVEGGLPPRSALGVGLLLTC